jgi:hypothetical protein
MAASTALLQSQIATLQEVSRATFVRRKRKRKALRSDNALSVGEVQAMIDQEEIEAKTIEEMPRLKKRPPTCSTCREKGHNMGQCKVV